MIVIPTALNADERLTYAIGAAFCLDRMVRDSLERFVDPMAFIKPRERSLPELAEAAKVKALMGDVGTSDHDRIDAEAAAAIEGAIQAALDAHERAVWLIDGDWAPLNGSATEYANIHMRDGHAGRPQPETITIGDIQEVLLEIHRANFRLGALTFLSGDFFQGDREQFLRLARGEPPEEAAPMAEA